MYVVSMLVVGPVDITYRSAYAFPKNRLRASMDVVNMRLKNEDFGMTGRMHYLMRPAFNLSF
jgi:hypothetical protein